PMDPLRPNPHALPRNRAPSCANVRARPMSERDLPGHGPGVPTDPELPSVQEQLIVFARELGELYRLEGCRNGDAALVVASLQDTYLAQMNSLATVIEAKD